MSDHKSLVETYFEGFRRSDHNMILGCLTDDVVWDLPGFRHLEGKAAFDGEIVNENFVGRPTLHIDRLLEDGAVVVAIGTGSAQQKDGRVFAFAYCDLFTFAGDKIRRVESYLVPLHADGGG